MILSLAFEARVVDCLNSMQLCCSVCGLTTLTPRTDLTIGRSIELSSVYRLEENICMYVCVVKQMHHACTVRYRYRLLSVIDLHIESRLRAIGQHQRNGAIIDPHQLGQSHRIQPGHIRYGGRGIALGAARLRLS